MEKLGVWTCIFTIGVFEITGRARNLAKLQRLRDFPVKFGLRKMFLDCERWPIHTPPIHTPIKSLPTMRLQSSSGTFFRLSIDGPHHQPPITSVRKRATLADHSAIPRERMLHELMPVARFESRHNGRRAYEDSFLCFGGSYDRQRTPVVRIAAIALASDSATTIARFRPSAVELCTKAAEDWDSKGSLKD